MSQHKPPAGFRVFNGTSTTTAWVKPLPLVGQHERAEYPLDALPAAIRGAVLEVQEAVMAPAEMVASSALAVASLAAQHLADVRRSSTLTGPCSLFFLTVAESGDRKSTVDRLLGRAVQEFQDVQRDASKSTQANHAADVVAWQAKRDATAAKLESDAKSNKTIEGHRVDLAQIESQKPEPPRIPRLLFEDVTPERLGKALATEWPSAGLFSSEGGAVLGGHSMSKDALTRTLSLLCKLWDGASHVVDRQTAASFTVRGARLSAALQVQPAVLADFMERDRGLSRGSGFMARFLISAPASLQGQRLYREPSHMPELGGFLKRIGEMLAELPQIDGERGMILPELELGPDAKAAWVQAYNAIEGQLSTGGDFASIRDAASKAADNIARLASVLHCFEYGAQGQIGLPAIESARRIVVWHLYAARSVLAPFSLSREAANAATLDGWLIDRCRMEGVDGFSVRTVLNAGPNSVRRKEAFEKAAAILAQHRRARLVEINRRRSIKVNPALLDGTAGYDEDDEPDSDQQAAVGWD